MNVCSAYVCVFLCVFVAINAEKWYGMQGKDNKNQMENQ